MRRLQRKVENESTARFIAFRYVTLICVRVLVRSNFIIDWTQKSNDSMTYFFVRAAIDKRAGSVWYSTVPYRSGVFFICAANSCDFVNKFTTSQRKCSAYQPPTIGYKFTPIFIFLEIKQIKQRNGKLLPLETLMLSLKRPELRENMRIR